VDRVHAVLLTGGSAFGLDAASGVMRWLEDRGHGLQVGPALVPIVPAAVLFDLWHPKRHIRPNAAAGYAACEDAVKHKGDAVQTGRIGAGAGCLVGKFFGPDRASPGGIGYASWRIGAHGVAAIVAVNALGDVVNAQGDVICGARTADGQGFEDCAKAIHEGRVLAPSQFNLPPPPAGSNTTIGAILTDAKLSKVQAQRIAQCAHDGLARSISPVHTASDGDTLFCMGSGAIDAPFNLTALCAVAADVVAEAVRRAAMTQ
jgi:L-aminopeptidase/D-esterase-like protein